MSRQENSPQKVVLIHCYSDRNRGDLGIMLATIDLLKSHQPDIKISAISTFEEHDPLFHLDHEELKKHVDHVYPAILGRAYSESGKIALAARVAGDLVLNLLLLFGGTLLRSRFIKSLLGKKHAKTVAAIQEADLVISKGGSFLTAESTILGRIRLLRLLGILSFATRLNRNCVVWGQSLGPVPFGCRSITSAILARCARVILREDTCLQAYPYLADASTCFETAFDLAFSLEYREDHPPEPTRKRIVGLTLKPFSSQHVDQLYSQGIVSLIENLVEREFEVAIIPHVTIDQDQSKAAEILSSLSQGAKEKVTEFGEMSIEHLLEFYSSLEVLVGTRLHSTIFAMSVGTLCINISYHGTKSKGVFESIGLPEQVLEIDESFKEKLQTLVDLSLGNRELEKKTRQGVERAKHENLSIARSLLDGITFQPRPLKNV